MSKRLSVLLTCALALTACGTRVQQGPMGEASAPVPTSLANSGGGEGGGEAVRAEPAREVGHSVGDVAPKAGAAVPRVVPQPLAKSTVSPAPASGAGATGRNKTEVPATPSPAPGAPAPAAAGPPPANIGTTTSPGASVAIGTLATLSGPGGELARDSVDAVAVWVKWINGRGGVNGHPVRHIVADDGADPARHRALERDLVERQKILAFVFKSEIFAGFSEPDPYLVSKRIPAVGTILGFDYEYDSPFYFPTGSAGTKFNTALLGAWAEVALPKGHKKMAIFNCVETSACTLAGDTWQAHGRDFGFEIVSRTKTSITQPDYTAECLSARNAGAQILGIALDDKTIARVAQSCSRQGFRPLLAGTFHTARPNLTSDGRLAGMTFVVGSMQFAFPAADTPARQEFHTVLAQLLSGRPVTGGHSLGWAAAKLFETATRTLADPPTTESILQSLWSIRNNDLEGLTQPLSFFPDRGAQAGICWSTVVLVDGRYTAPQGGGLRCRP